MEKKNFANKKVKCNINISKRNINISLKKICKEKDLFYGIY